MADLAVREAAPLANMPQSPQGEAGALISMIERAVRDPAVDMDKMERLFAMHERATARQAEVAYADAMSAAQSELGPVAADANNPQTRSRYASYAALDRAVRPVYVRHGFALSFGTADSPAADHIRLTCKVTHRGGHAEPFHVDMPADGKGAKGGDVMTKTHAAGAAMSYGQRYLLKLIFNIAVGDDVDGNTPVSAERISSDQAADLQAKMEEVGADAPKFLKYLRVERLGDLPLAHLTRAYGALETKARAR